MHPAAGAAQPYTVTAAGLAERHRVVKGRIAAREQDRDAAQQLVAERGAALGEAEAALEEPRVAGPVLRGGGHGSQGIRRRGRVVSG